MKRLALTLVALATLVGSCRPDPKSITLEILPTYNGVPFHSGETLFKGDTAIKFDLVHMYLNNFEAGNTLLEDVIFVNIDDSTSLHYEFTLENYEEGMGFGIGLDSIQNAMDPTTFSVDDPLSSANAMYWSWATKYRFIKIDGRTNVNGTFGTDDNLLAWHTGLDELYRTVRWDDVDINPGDHLIIEFHLEDFIQGVNLQTETITHTTVDDMDIAVKLSDNAVNSFTLQVQ